MNPTKISCEICDLVLTKMVNYSQHKAAHIGVKPFFCNICSKTFLSEPNYCAHLSYHCEGVSETKLSKKQYVCHICETVCTCYGNLAEHYLDHLVRMNIFCEECKLYFNDEKDYAIHQHLHQKDGVCKVCGCEFFKKSEMLKHVQSHNPNKYFSHFNGKIRKKLSWEKISKDFKMLAGESEKNLSKPDKHRFKFIRGSKKLKISPNLFGGNFPTKSATALDKNISRKCNIKISTKKKKNSKKNVELSHKKEKNVKKIKTPVEKLSTSVVNSTSLLVDSSLEKLQRCSKNLPIKECQQSKTLLLPNFKSSIVKKSPVVSCTMNDKVDAKIINNNSLANSSLKDLIKCKSVLSIKGGLIKKSNKCPSLPITVLKHLNNKTDERVYGLKECSVLINKLPFFVQNYESYLLFMESSKYCSEKHLNVSVTYILKCLKTLEGVFQDDVKSLSILRHVKNIYENQKSVTAEKELNFFLYELCTIYYDKIFKDVSNTNSLKYKNNSEQFKNSALSNSEDIKETLFTLKRRIHNIQKTLNVINTTKQVKNIKHLKILLRRLPDDIFKKYVKEKPIMLSTVMPVIC